MFCCQLLPVDQDSARNLMSAGAGLICIRSPIQ